MFSIQNCTVSFQYCKRSLLDQEFLQLARHGINTEYAPQKFHAVIMRLPLREATTTAAQSINMSKMRTVAALIFKTGSVVLTGVPRPADAERIAERVCRRLRVSWKEAEEVERQQPTGAYKRQINFAVHHLQITNFVASFTHCQRLAIERLYQHLLATSRKTMLMMTKNNISIHSPRYDPSIFPALRFKLTINTLSITASCLLYASGKCIVTGIRGGGDPPCPALSQIHSFLLNLLSQFSLD